MDNLERYLGTLISKKGGEVGHPPISPLENAQFTKNDFDQQQWLLWQCDADALDASSLSSSQKRDISGRI